MVNHRPREPLGEYADNCVEYADDDLPSGTDPMGDILKEIMVIEWLDGLSENPLAASLEDEGCL